ncbi:hypothetical protein BKK54_02025 [Rodentibacter genomosp. 1]|uniref:Uncharacterized protein n=1 Tax=Rodentibacter genomosp. 1 TaxID=1908264 RepID=A0A1V3J918_9PAST|nr:hypothetical protein BKK54_02025 [Rodentibacter genomosp. 1]
MLRVVRCGYFFAFQEKIKKFFIFLNKSAVVSVLVLQDKSKLSNFKGEACFFINKWIKKKSKVELAKFFMFYNQKDN